MNNKIDFPPLSAEIIKEFGQIRNDGNSVLYRLQYVTVKALASFHRNWRHEEDEKKKALWMHVTNEAKRLLVGDVPSGAKGWTLGTFRNYMSRVKKSIMYQVDIFTAETTPTEVLREAHDLAEKTAEDAGSVKIDKYMPIALKEVKKARETRAAKKTLGLGMHSFPNPNEHKDGEALALATIKQINAFLTHIRPRIKGISAPERLLHKLDKLVLEYQKEHALQFAEYEEDMAAAA